MYFNIYLISFLFIQVMMSLLFLLAQKKKDNSIVDVFWGIGFCLISMNAFLLAGEYDKRKFLMLVMVLAWGIRLALYIYQRNKGKGEDFRYAAWRKEWGNKAAWIAFWKVFMLQGAFMFIISLPIMHVMYFSMQFGNVLDVIGLTVWLSGYMMEAIADRQMKMFKADSANKGKIIQQGLWSISRHPNYLGEILVWWGIFIVSLNADRWYISLISPLVVTWLLSSVSGVPMLERKYKNKPEFQEYAKRVPALVPNFEGLKKLWKMVVSR